MANINELSSFAGGAAQGLQAGSTMRINAQDARIRQAQEDRVSRDDQLSQAFKQLFSQRPPDPGQSQPSPQPAAPAGALPVPPPAASGAQTFPLPANNAAPAQPPPAGSPAAAPSALPASAAAGAAPSQGAYRDRYQNWRQNALAAAMRVGGIEGAKLFNDFENSNVRGQMLMYGQQGLQALNSGQVGDAAKFLNTALELSPVDTGMEWVAYDGKLFLKGSDGQMTAQPYNVEALRTRIESTLLTPENYLAFQEQLLAERTQTETERRNLEDEELRAGALDVQERVAGVQERQITLEEAQRPRETAAKEAQALAELISAKGYAERSRAAAAAAQAEETGWTSGQFLQLMRDADSWEQDQSMLLPKSIDAFRVNPEEFVKFKSDVIDQMTVNAPGAVTRERAGFVSQILRHTPGVDYSQFLDGNGQVKPGLISFAMDKKTGQVRVIYDGQSWILPPGLADIALQRKAPMGGGAPAPAPQAPPAAPPVVLPETQVRAGQPTPRAQGGMALPLGRDIGPGAAGRSSGVLDALSAQAEQDRQRMRGEFPRIGKGSL